MTGKDIRIRASGGGEFDCYLAVPEGGARVPAVLLASAIHGVEGDIRAIADEFAGRGYIAAAPDLFWRTVPARARDDARAAPRGQPRLEKIARARPTWPTRSGPTSALQRPRRAMGFCYGGPFAIWAARLGFDAGIGCHSTQMKDYIGALEGVTKPVCLLWGDLDHAAPAEVLDAYRAVPARIGNVEIHIFPGILHGYMMPGNAKAFHAQSREFSMSRAFAILERLRAAAEAEFNRRAPETEN